MCLESSAVCVGSNPTVRNCNLLVPITSAEGNRGRTRGLRARVCSDFGAWVCELVVNDVGAGERLR